MKSKQFDLDNWVICKDKLSHILDPKFQEELVNDYKSTKKIYDSLSADSYEFIPNDPIRPFVMQLQERIKKFLCDEYLYVIAYHSCRIYDIKEYSEQGVRIASKDF